MAGALTFERRHPILPQTLVLQNSLSGRVKIYNTYDMLHSQVTLLPRRHSRGLNKRFKEALHAPFFLRNYPDCIIAESWC